MPTGRNEGEPRDAAKEIAEIARLLTEIGPDVNAIARRAGVYKETVRYRVKSFILRKGIDLQATVDCEGLGLMRIVARTELNETFSPYAQQLFYALSELTFLTAYQLSLPDGFWLLHFSVPPESRVRFEGFITRLKELGIFDSVEFLEYDWFRNVPMRTESYDFRSHRWDFDWTTPPRDSALKPPVLKQKRFDAIDLLILKELEIDSNRSLMEIRDALAAKKNGDINYKTLSYHYRDHVRKKRLVKGYAIRWLGTGYDAEMDKVGHRKHRYVILNVVVRDVTPLETMHLRKWMNHLPFLWAEMAGKDYAAQLAFPVELVNDAFKYITVAIGPVALRAKVFVDDQKNSVSFTVPYKSWSVLDKKWQFDEESLVARFQNLILEIRRG